MRNYIRMVVLPALCVFAIICTGFVCSAEQVNGYRTYGDVLDSSDAPITDSNLDTVIGRTYSSDLLRDSNGDVIEGRAIFVIK